MDSIFDLENTSLTMATTTDFPTLVDWDSIQIQEEMEEEGNIELCNEEQVYDLLGLRREDEIEEEIARQAALTSRGDEPSASVIHNVEGIEGASIPVDDYIPEETMMMYDQDNPSMALGTIYPSMAEFRLAMRQYAINKEFELGIEATNKSKYRGYCKGGECPWSIVGYKKPGGVTVTVTVLNDVHTCTSSSRRRTTTPSCKWVASKVVSILRTNPQMGAKDLQSKLQNDYNCTIAYDTVWRGKEKALEQLYGTWEKSFQLLYNWKAEVMKRSPDSVIEIDCKTVRGKVYFYRFFCALGPCIEGFRSGCRPWLGVDATALNGRWNGHLAAATGVDGHNWMYPVAFGFIDSETEENWTWFMTQLHKLVGDLPELAICSDACKGLLNAVKNVFPQVDQRECFRHLMKNFSKRFHGESVGHMWPAARAYDKDIYEMHMSKVYAGNSEAKKWLEEYHKLKWQRSYFNSDIKCDYVTNNVAESFNNWIKDIKDMPVVELVDKIREMIMTLFHNRRRIGQRLHGRILPAVLQILRARTRGLGHLSVIKGDNQIAEVWDNCNHRFVVRACSKECSCDEWQHTGKPCQHALSLITAQQIRNVMMEDFVHDYYSVDKFRKAYARLVEPMPHKEKWPTVELPFDVAAPLSKRGAGRQRKNRIKSCLEGGTKSKSVSKSAENENEKTKKMIRGKVRCPNCGELGHRKSSYKCPLNGTKKRPRKPRKNTTKNWFPKDSTPERTSTIREQIIQSSPGVMTRGRLNMIMEEDACEETSSYQALQTREQIIQQSPGIMTRGRLNMLTGEGTSHETFSSQTLQTSTAAPKKMTPRKAKRILKI